MKALFRQKHAPIKTISFLIVLAIICLIVSYWWSPQARLSDIQAKKQLEQTINHCKKLKLNLTSSDNKDIFNAPDRTLFIKRLNSICIDLKNISGLANVKTTPSFSRKIFLYSTSIIFLLLISYFIIRYYRALNPNGHDTNIAKAKFYKVVQSRNIEKDSQKKEKQQYINFAEITHKALLQLVEEPESTEPFTLCLNELLTLTDATSSAIFIRPDTASELTLLACTDLSDPDWSETVPTNILPKVTSFETTEIFSEFFEESVQPEYKFICIQLHHESKYPSLLVLKLMLNINLNDSTNLILLEHSNELAKIVSSICKARLKLRQSQYEERAVIARELHDSLAQSLSYLKIQTSRLQNILTGSDIQNYSKSMEIDAMMQDIRANLNIAYRHLRELISTFRLTMGGKNFSQALSDSVEEFSKRSGIAFDVDNRLPANILTVTEETQLLHIIRESLSNVVRHSQAKFSLISIHFNNLAQVTTIIEDDGIGLPDISNPEQHFGIIIMQERAHSIGGSISLAKRANGGARLKVVFRASKHIKEHQTNRHIS